MALKCIVVGGVAGGASAAARLRRLNEDAEIVIYERGPYVSFSNCGIPYHISGVIQKEENLLLMSPEEFSSQYNILALVNREVIKVDPVAKKVVVRNTQSGETFEDSYDKLVLSPGTAPLVPPFPGLDLIPHFTLRTVPDVSKIVKFLGEKERGKDSAPHVTVIGGGFIGIEAVENLIERGVRVTLVELMDQVLTPLDYDMVHPIHKILLDKGVELKLKTKVVGFESGKVLLDGGDSVETDGVILSIGIKADTEFLKDSGLELDDRNYLIVNKNYQTSNPDIYAVGDAIQVTNGICDQVYKLPLAGPANKQGRMAATHIGGGKVINKGFISSYAIQVFNYTAAGTGLSERFIKMFNVPIDYEVAYAGPGDRVGIMPGAEVVMLKLLFEKKTGRILGAQALGKGLVEKRVDVIATAIKAEMTVEDLLDLELCYAPPYGTGKDAVNHLGYIGSNLLNGDFAQKAFHEVYELHQQGAQIIDVREKNEYEAGHIKSAKNIPMSQMRQRVGEIDKSKPVYVHCRTGQRSYNMTLLLKGLGYDVYNLAGSYYFVSFYEDTHCRMDPSRERILTKPNFS